RKEQNRRNPQKVIDLANQIRIDGLQQQPSSDPNAPNMIDENTVKQGNIKFIYSSTPDLEPVRQYLGWDFTDSKETKELNLTHNLIADKGGFGMLMEIYDRDRIIELKNLVKKQIADNNIQIQEGVTFREVYQDSNIALPSRISG